MLDFNNSLIFEKKDSFKFKSFGVKIEVTATHQKHLKEIYERIVKALPQNFEIIENQEVEHIFSIEYTKDKIIKFKKDGKGSSETKSEKVLFNFLESKIRLTVAEFAVSRVFLHAGVVVWKDKAIIIPANSYQGKTTLVKELLRCGATYYSDEYAVLDEDGFVHPFPKTLSVRGIIDDYQQLECSAESFGGKVGIEPCEVGLVLITKFEQRGIWDPKILNLGEGIMEIIPHTLPIRLNPKFTLQVLNLVASRAIICKSLRGEAEESAKKILDFFELNA